MSTGCPCLSGTVGSASTGMRHAMHRIVHYVHYVQLTGGLGTQIWFCNAQAGTHALHSLRWIVGLEWAKLIRQETTTDYILLLLGHAPSFVVLTLGAPAQKPTISSPRGKLDQQGQRGFSSDTQL